MSHSQNAAATYGIAFAIAAGMLVLPARSQNSEDPPARIARLENAVLAPCCYREPVARHQSEIAIKMRLEIEKWVAGGRSDGDILGTYVERYGSKVLVDPRSIPGWWTPWIPWMAVILATGFGFWRVQRWQAKPVLATAPGAEVPALPDLEDEELGG